MCSISDGVEGFGGRSRKSSGEANAAESTSDMAGSGVDGCELDMHRRRELRDGCIGEKRAPNELACPEANPAALVQDGCMELSRTDVVRLNVEGLDGIRKISYVNHDGKLQVLLR